MEGIYYIHNEINNKLYIGQSLDIEKRWEKHIFELNNNKHHSYRLQEDWNKHGELNFTFKSKEIKLPDGNASFKKAFLYAYEHYYIEKHNTIKNGYNLEDTFFKAIDDEISDVHSKKYNARMCYILAIINDFHFDYCADMYNYLVENRCCDYDYINKNFKELFTRTYLNKLKKGKLITFEQFENDLKNVKPNSDTTIFNITNLARVFMRRKYNKTGIQFRFKSLPSKKTNPSEHDCFIHIPKSSGILCFENKIDGKKYITHSENMNKFCNSLMQSVRYDFLKNEGGMCNFEISVLEETQKVSSELRKLKYTYIKNKKTYLSEFGYNTYLTLEKIDDYLNN